MNSNHKTVKKRKPKKNPLPIIILLCVLVIVALVILLVSINANKKESQTVPDTTVLPTETTTPETSADTTAQPQEVPSDDWKLLLVNRTHPLPDGFSVETTEISAGKYVDARIAEPLTNLINAAANDGYNIVVRSGYRTYDEQMSLYKERLARLIENGMSQADAEAEISEWVAYPGTSEHQTGLACDINGDRVKTTDDQAYEWLTANSYKYGFIYRYPQEKTDITGVTNEPWHIRYVGEKAAAEIHEWGICLEEYLGLTE